MLKFEEYLEKDYVPQGKANANYTKKGLSGSTIEYYMNHIKRFYKYLLHYRSIKKKERLYFLR